MIKNTRWGALGAMAFLLCATACAGPEQTTAVWSEEDHLIKIGGKFDTGYYSSLAMELEGDFTSVLELDVTLLTEQQREALQDNTVLRLIAESQVKMAKNQLNEKKLHLNLTAGEVAFSDISTEDRADGQFLVATYSVVAETLVTFAELEEEGIDPLDLENTSYTVTVPGDPRDMLGRAGEACAEGHSTGSLEEANYFYYFEPHKVGCLVPMAAQASFTVRSLLPQEETFPEYDRLTEDGLVEVAVIFGAYYDGVPTEGDWGSQMYRTYTADLRISGWEEIEGLEIGQRYRRNRAGLEQVIDVYSPFDLYNFADTNAAFVELLRTQEIIAYNGHSFYGSLAALSHGENYPEDTYQILFMNSCWSYEYYTKQVFTHKATEDDPQGWLDVDVVNNTTYAYFPQMATATMKLMTNLLAGAENGGADNMGRRFSWQNVIGIVNDEARGVCPEDAEPEDCRHYQPKNAHEIYGVSGVRTNEFRPTF